MEVKIGVQHAPRELIVETDESAERSRSPWPTPSRTSGVLTLIDSKGRRIVVPADQLAYVEIGGGVSGHVGFRLTSRRATTLRRPWFGYRARDSSGVAGHD